MTVSTIYAPAYYQPSAGNVGLTSWPFGFRILDKTWLVVTRTTSAGVKTTLTLDIDYTVLGVDSYSGGSVEFSSAYNLANPMNGTDSLLVELSVPMTQETDFRNQGAFFAEKHEDAFDKVCMQQQVQQENIQRSLKINPADTGWDLTLPVTTVDGYVIGLDTVHKKLVLQAGGPTGAKGDAGTAGTNGNTTRIGAGAPAGALGSVNDLYINSTNWDLYLKTGASTWTLQGNIKGGAANPAHRETVAYYEAVMATTDKQPVIRFGAARSLVALHYYKDNAVANVGTTTVQLFKNGSVVTTITLAAGLANQTLTAITPSPTLPLAFAAGDLLRWNVSAVGATPPSNLSLIADFTETL